MKPASLGLSLYYVNRFYDGPAGRLPWHIRKSEHFRRSEEPDSQESGFSLGPKKKLEKEFLCAGSVMIGVLYSTRTQEKQTQF